MKYDNNKLPEKLVKLIEEADFSITYEGDNSIYFGKYSPYGQDFGFSVEMTDSIDGLACNIIDYYEDFDVSYESSLWIDESGHGKNGAPYELKDIIEDMESCEEYINELYRIIDDYIAVENKMIIYEDDEIIIRETGSKTDFIATVENHSDETIYIFPDENADIDTIFEMFEVEPNDWYGIFADDEGRNMVRAFKEDKFITTFDKEDF